MSNWCHACTWTGTVHGAPGGNDWVTVEPKEYEGANNPPDKPAGFSCSLVAGGAASGVPMRRNLVYSDCPCWTHSRPVNAWRGPIFDPELLESDTGRKELSELAKADVSRP